MITVSTVKKIASLSKLSFSDEELKNFTEEFSKILTFADKINELDTSGENAAAHASEVFNVLREDTVLPSLPREDALKNAPSENGESFIVPKIV